MGTSYRSMWAVEGLSPRKPSGQLDQGQPGCGAGASRSGLALQVESQQFAQEEVLCGQCKSGPQAAQFVEWNWCRPQGVRAHRQLATT